MNFGETYNVFSATPTDSLATPAQQDVSTGSYSDTIIVTVIC